MFVDAFCERRPDPKGLLEFLHARMVDSLAAAELSEQRLQFLGAESRDLLQWVPERGLGSALAMEGVHEAVRLVAGEHQQPACAVEYQRV